MFFFSMGDYDALAMLIHFNVCLPVPIIFKAIYLIAQYYLTSRKSRITIKTNYQICEILAKRDAPTIIGQIVWKKSAPLCPFEYVFVSFIKIKNLISEWVI